MAIAPLTVIWTIAEPQEIKALFPLSDVVGALSARVDAVSQNAFGAIIISKDD